MLNVARVSLSRLSRPLTVAILLAATAPSLGAATQAKVYWEAQVDKLALLDLHEMPTPAVPPGQTVSVTVSFVVTEQGNVGDARIQASGTPEIDTMVLDAIRTWKYVPAQKGGKPVAVRMLRKFTFAPPAQNPR
jgi:TonB family protein